MILTQLGLTETQARCFVGLSRVRQATAREISEIADVPVTRVYVAARVLEAQGLVEIQHSSPTRFRAVPFDVAAETLRGQFEHLLENLDGSIRALDPIDDGREECSQEVRTLTGGEAIANRTLELLGQADEEVVLVLGEERLLGDELLDQLRQVSQGCRVNVGITDESPRERIENHLSDATVFVPDLEWLHQQGPDDTGVAIGRLLLVDGGTLLVSSYDPTTGQEHAVCGSGLDNGLVTIIRRLLETGQLHLAGPN